MIVVKPFFVNLDRNVFFISNENIKNIYGKALKNYFIK
jgi:hypothetical protein